MPVVKHGNRSISSRCGSADLIEALGVALPLDESRSARCLEATGFTFLFAPYFHPAMRSLAPVRTALGVRTIFNLLGPLTNPAAPRYALIGAYDAAAAGLMADTVAGLGLERAWIVHGAGGWDEVTPMGPFLAFEVDATGVHRRDVDPAAFGIAPCEASELAGGDAGSNLAALDAVFAGSDRGAHREALVLQSGLALFIGGRATSIETGIAAARETIASGRAESWLAGLRRFGRAA
jgi:anthranilate phosphoribosyltransferase